jgi:hypothetical protein
VYKSKIQQEKRHNSGSKRDKIEIRNYRWFGVRYLRPNPPINDYEQKFISLKKKNHPLITINMI